MKFQEMLYPVVKCITVISLKKAGAGKLSKTIIVMSMLFMTMLLSSCFFPGAGHGHRGGMPEHHGNNVHHENNGRHH